MTRPSRAHGYRPQSSNYIDRQMCESCEQQPAAFRVKHHETCAHWRCLRCFRALLTECPIVVVGYANPTHIVDHLTANPRDLVTIAKAARMVAGREMAIMATGEETR